MTRIKMNPIALSMLVRLGQVVVTGIVLGLASGMVSESSLIYSDVVCALTVSALSMAYLIAVVIYPILRRIPFLAVVVGEWVHLGLWVVVLVVMVGDVGDFGRCSVEETRYSGYARWKLWCRLGRAIIAFSVFGVLLSAVSLVMMVVLTVIPVCKKFSWVYIAESRHNDFVPGAIYCKIPMAMDEELQGEQLQSEGEESKGEEPPEVHPKEEQPHEQIAETEITIPSSDDDSVPKKYYVIRIKIKKKNKDSYN